MLAHLDPGVLERELLERVGAAQPEGSIDRPLVIVPTARLAGHVQRRLIEKRAAWLGVEVLPFRTLARRILECAGERVPSVISARLLDALLARVVGELRDGNSWARFAGKRLGALAALARACRELRDAGVRHGELTECAERAGCGADLVELYRGYAAALDRLAGHGRVDDAGLVAAALPHAAAFAAERPAILVHGAYELIGIHLELLRALDGAVEVTALVPFLPGAPVSTYAEAFAARYLLGREGRPEAPAVEVIATRLAGLWDEESRPGPEDAGRIVFRHTQGAAAEVRLAVRLALQAVREGCPPHEIVIAARGLSPYVEAFEATFEEEGLPWTTSLATPLRRHPAIHDLMLVLENLARDFPRRATAEMLRSPRIAWKALTGGEAPPRGDHADRWSRQAGVVGGLREWTDVLESWATAPEPAALETAREQEEQRRLREERIQEVRRIGRALTALRDRVEPERRRCWAEHAREIGGLLATALRTPDDSTRTALDAVETVLVEMRGLETVARETEPVGFAEMVQWLGDAVDGTELALHGQDHGGVRVLDAMRARGLTCRRLILIGMNAGQLPHPPREDPVLPDALRIELRRSTGRPIPVKAEGAHEERLLLGMLLGSASERVEISWQRADESGRARTPSLALRELARLALGRPDIEALVDGAEHVPSHPEHWLRRMAEEPGLLHPSEERLLTVFRAGHPSPELERFYPELAPGLTMLRATEAFHDVDGGYDARVGPCLAGSLSVSALEMLGRCPLQHFFRHRLRVRELDEETGAFEIAANDLGGRVHGLLEAVYGRLREEERFAGASVDPVRERAAALLDEKWTERMGDLARRISRRAPALWAMLERSWRDALHAFVAEDLRRIVDGGWGTPELEREVEGEVAIGAGRRIRVHGRFDRWFETERGPVVGDYKTGSIKDLDNVTKMLKGGKLQVPLYWMLAGEKGRVEVLGVGPSHHDPTGVEKSRSTFDGFKKKREREGFLETLGTLAALLDRGCYPLHSDTHCGWCAWSLACRLKHPPTLEREGHTRDAEAYRLTGHKSTRSPTLADVRKAR